MAKKQDDALKRAKAGAKAPKAAQSAEPSSARRSTPKSDPRSAPKPAEALKSAKSPKPTMAPSTLEVARTTIEEAPGKAKKAAKQAAKAAKENARRLTPDVPSPNIDVSGTVKEIGGQIVAVMNSGAGRVILAELLVFLAGVLTKAAANTEVAEDAKTAVVNAGAKVGAAMASAGARIAETGSSAASAGADAIEDGVEAASGAAGTAKDLARELTQVAVGAVGGMVVDAAQKMIKGKSWEKSGKSAGDKSDKPAERHAPTAS